MESLWNWEILKCFRITKAMERFSWNVHLHLMHIVSVQVIHTFTFANENNVFIALWPNLFALADIKCLHDICDFFSGYKNWSSKWWVEKTKRTRKLKKDDQREKDSQKKENADLQVIFVFWKSGILLVFVCVCVFLNYSGENSQS